MLTSSHQLIHEFVSTYMKRHGTGKSLDASLKFAGQQLDADRALVWKNTTGVFRVTNEYRRDPTTQSLLGSIIEFDKSVSLAADLVTKWLDSASVSAIQEDELEFQTWRTVQTIQAPFSHGLVLPIRPPDFFLGFVIFQTLKPNRWSSLEREVLSDLARFLSVVSNYTFLLEKAEEALAYSQLLLKVDELFFDSYKSDLDATINSAKEFAVFLGFSNFTTYFVCQNDKKLINASDSSNVISLQDVKNPIVQAVNEKHVVNFLSDGSQLLEAPAGQIVFTSTIFEHQTPYAVMLFWGLKDEMKHRLPNYDGLFSRTAEYISNHLSKSR